MKTAATIAVVTTILVSMGTILHMSDSSTCAVSLCQHYEGYLSNDAGTCVDKLLFKYGDKIYGISLVNENDKELESVGILKGKTSNKDELVQVHKDSLVVCQYDTQLLNIQRRSNDT